MKLKINQAKEIKGEIKISGAKNAVLPLMCAALLTNELQVLTNVPHISDVDKMMNILKYINCFIDYNIKEQELFIKTTNLKSVLDIKEVSSIRASYYLMGIYIAKGLDFKTIYPGGCSFSKRPIDYHLNAFRQMGYKIIEKEKFLCFKKIKKYPSVLTIDLPQKSLGATINIMFAASLQKSITTINNASFEPEVMEIVKILNNMGCCIKILNDSIVIEGRNKLYGVKHRVISDRIEAGSYMLLASAVDKSELIIKNVDIETLEEVINVLRKMKVEITTLKNQIVVRKNNKIEGLDLVVDAYPAFPTDLQQLLCVVCTKAINSSRIKDLVYPNRLSQLEEIKKAGGNIKFEDGYIYINPSNLKAALLTSHDLRCGFACIIIGCIAEGVTDIKDIEYILRGYEDLIYKLNSIGLKIEYIDY